MRALDEGRKKKRIEHSHLVVKKKKKTDFIHSYVRNCIMFLIGRERRRCFACQVYYVNAERLKNRVIMTWPPHVGSAEVVVCVEGHSQALAQEMFSILSCYLHLFFCVRINDWVVNFSPRVTFAYWESFASTFIFDIRFHRFISTRQTLESERNLNCDDDLSTSGQRSTFVGAIEPQLFHD